MQGSLQALQRPRALSQGPGRPSRRRLVVRADALDPSRSLERQQSLASREETITALNTVVVPAGIESPKRSQQEKSFTVGHFQSVRRRRQTGRERCVRAAGLHRSLHAAAAARAGR